MKNKLMVALLISVFMLSVSAVVAEDTVEVDELAIDDANDTIAVSEDSDEILAATEENTETLTATENDETLTASASDEATDVDIKVVVLDKNPKVGDKVRVKLILTNLGSNDAKNVEAQFSFTDI